MTTRDEFEKWASENWIDGLPKMIALKVWEASRALALEEAAKECDEISRIYEEDSPFHSGGADRCAETIRALAKAEGGSHANKNR